MLNFFVLMFASVLTVCLGSFVTPIIRSSGLFFDQMPDVKFTNDKWNVVTYIDISHIQPHLDNVEFLFAKISTFCKSHSSSKVQIDCLNSLSALQNQHANNIKKFSSISYLVQSPARVKRGLIDAGGSILKTFFGTLDSDDAIKFTDAIHQVQSDEKKLAHVMKDNIHIVKSTILSLNNTISKVNENEARLNQNLDVVEKAFEQLRNSNDKLDIKTHLNSLLNSMESIIMSLSFDIDDINNAILFSKLNILHPTVLSPYQLYNELEQNANNLPKHYELPTSLSLQNIHDIVDVSSLICYYHYNKIVIVIKIPLVIPQTYSLYHLISLPVPYDISKPDTFALIAPNKPYLAVTADRMFYSLFDSVKECKVITNKCYVCELNNIYSTIATPTCETILLNDVVSKLPSLCVVKILHGSIDMFYKLRKNRWIFVQSEPGKCHITCENDPNNYDEILFGTGLLNLQKRCNAFFKTLQFSASDTIVTNITTNAQIMSSFNIIFDDCCEKNKINKTLPQLPFVRLNNINNLDSLVHASTHLDQLQQELNKLENTSHLEKYSVHYLSLTSLTSALVILYMFYKTRICLYHKSSPLCCIKMSRRCNRRRTNNEKSAPIDNPQENVPESESSPSTSDDEPVSIKRNIIV
ncbi:uncharacterized protein isoform X1 [Choristoneura fumiferana]|uniref:uncharacterized protein isoform X1 n=2 Tax=Choristoneura fumiferana TaxID=7141 RepID=UPI003D1536F1